jgi:formylglycine-generating enzyme required for sulfatase activity
MSGNECQGVSCCENILVPGGTFPMGRSENGTDAYAAPGAGEVPEHEATVDSFYLDTFEVTVGRFRRFVEQYDGTPPAEGAGAVPSTPESGWVSSAFDYYMPESQAELREDLGRCDWNSTWTESAQGNEASPLTCVSWDVAFAFCIWDGGRLPTEAEWERAAAGGDENRLYPWGAPSPDATLANFSGGAAWPLVPVGSTPLGGGRWGHQDLAGSVEEYVRDSVDNSWYSGDGNPCNNCVNLRSDFLFPVVRGGDWNDGPTPIRAAARGAGIPPGSWWQAPKPFGLRCLRAAM